MPADKLPLPRGLFRHHRKYRARHSHAHGWEYFGNDYAQAVAAFAAWKASGGERDTVSWLLDIFTAHVCPAKVRAGQLAKRTARDYKQDAAILKRGLGHFGIGQLQPQHIAQYRNARAQDAPSHVRNEILALSDKGGCLMAVSDRPRSVPCVDVRVDDMIAIEEA